MNNITRTALTLLGGAVFLGILADLILKETWGFNIFIFISVFAVLIAVFRRRESHLDGHAICLLVSLVAVSATFMWRDADVLKVLGMMTLLAIAAALTFRKLGIDFSLAGVFHYVIGFIQAGISVVFGPFVFLNRDFKSEGARVSGVASSLFSIAKGIAIAIPLLLIFTGLFSSADPRFQTWVEWVAALPVVEFTFEHLLTIGIWSWIFYGYLRGSSAFFKPAGENRDSSREDSVGEGEGLNLTGLFRIAVKDLRSRFDVMNFDNTILPKPLTLGAIEVSVALGLLNLLFILFVAFQVEYLFGGFNLVQQTADMKLADYARNGFGELVVVSFLVLPVLLFADWLVRRTDQKAKTVFRILAASLIALLFVIMASAIQRFMILTGELGYGFTAPRFYALTFIIWLAVLFVWFLATVLTGRRSRFALGVFWSGMIFLFGLNVMNPDEFIVRRNIALMEKGRDFDAEYSIYLGHDAVQPLLEIVPKLDGEARCDVKRALIRNEKELSTTESWLSWNSGRSRARALLASNRDVFSNHDTECPVRPDPNNED